MEILSEAPAAYSSRDKPSRPAAAPSRKVSETLSQPSYNAYPAYRAFISTFVHPQTRVSFRPASHGKAFPESNSAVILSALRNLQEKIRRLEFEKAQELSLRSIGQDARHKHQHSDSTANGLPKDRDAKRKTNDQSNCNQVLITHLAAAEARCEKLERQLEQMRRMLRGTRTEKTSLFNEQAFVATVGANNQHHEAVSEHGQSEKLERLEQEYRRLTRTQKNAEVKICELERKLIEEENQRKLIQYKANQLQTGLEASMVLLQNVSPRLSSWQDKNSSSKRSSTRHREPQYRLSLKDLPFVTGRSVACSHSVRANVQAVLSLLKRHQPPLCNHSDGASTSSSTSGEELSELLQALQEELHLMDLEQGELMRQAEESVSERERKELQMEQERLLLRIERKGEQISKLCKHKLQIKKLRKEAKSRTSSRIDERGATRWRSAPSTKAQPGERFKKNLRLLKDMKALQASFKT